MKRRKRIRKTSLDSGTEELQRKRAQLFSKGSQMLPQGGATLLGVLLSQHVLTEPLYDAGVRLSELAYQFEPCLAHSFRPTRSPIADVTGGTLSDHNEEKRSFAWRVALETLKQAGREPYRVTLRVVFYDGNLYEGPRPRLALREVKALRLGLAALEAYFKGGSRGRLNKLYG